MNSVILFREDLNTENELAYARMWLPTFRQRTEVPPNSLVFGRYSVHPFYEELERDLAVNGSRLVNSYSEHSYIADVTAWACNELKGLTPRTWTDWAFLPEGSYVLKGKTNSRKNLWKTHMFAPTKADVPIVAGRLLDDSLISEQGLVVREYVPLKQIAVGVQGTPITNEWRTFWYGDTMIASDFYWGSHWQIRHEAKWSPKALALAREAANRIKDYAMFFVLDIAETAAGDWIVIEVNDAQMAGLSCIDPNEFYRALSNEIRSSR